MPHTPLHPNCSCQDINDFCHTNGQIQWSLLSLQLTWPISSVWYGGLLTPSLGFLQLTHSSLLHSLLYQFFLKSAISNMSTPQDSVLRHLLYLFRSHSLWALNAIIHLQSPHLNLQPCSRTPYNTPPTGISNRYLKLNMTKLETTSWFPERLFSYLPQLSK